MYDNKRLALSIFWVVLGAVLLGLSLAEKLDTVYAGMGGALITVGALQIARNLRYRRDADYREKVDIEMGDERGKFLRMKSWSFAGYITMLIEGIGAVVAMAMGQRTVQMVLSLSVFLMAAVFRLSHLVLSRKY